MIIKKITKFIICILISIAFLILFASNLSPLASNYYNGDSAMFLLFGKAMKNGLIAYKDLFDHKGPYLFLIYQISQLLFDGKLGAFFVEVINLAICLYIALLILDLAKEKIEQKYRIVSIALILWYLIATLEGGGGVEEFSLPYLLFSLYLFLLYTKGINKYHRPIYAFVYGTFFAFLAFSRITNSAFLCAIVLTITIELLINRMYKNLLENIIAFIFGILIGSLPICLYYWYNDALYEMLYSTFIFASKYATYMSLSDRICNYLTIDKIVFLIPLFLSIIICKKIKEYKTIYFRFAVISTIATFLETFIGYSYLHYFVLIVPNIVFALFLYIQNDDISNKKTNKLIILFILSVFLVQGCYNGIEFASTIIHTVDYTFTYDKFGYYEELTELSKDIVSKIPQEDRDKIWAYNSGSSFYLRADISPCIKYFDYIGDHEKYGNIKNEIIENINNDKIKWLVIDKTLDLSDYMKNEIKEKFTLSYENDKYSLYLIN